MLPHRHRRTRPSTAGPQHAEWRATVLGPVSSRWNRLPAARPEAPGSSTQRHLDGRTETRGVYPGGPASGSGRRPREHGLSGTACGAGPWVRAAARRAGRSSHPIACPRPRSPAPAEAAPAPWGDVRSRRQEGAVRPTCVCSPPRSSPRLAEKPLHWERREPAGRRAPETGDGPLNRGRRWAHTGLRTDPGGSRRRGNRTQPLCPIAPSGSIQCPTLPP